MVHPINLATKRDSVFTAFSSRPELVPNPFWSEEVLDYAPLAFSAGDSQV